MNEEMTIEEIESQFESEWVLIEDPRTDEALQVLGGRVLHHSKDRDEVYRKAVSLRPKRSAIVYTGEIPQGTAEVYVVRASQSSNANPFIRPNSPVL
jgi:hypothetical protein